MFNDELLRVLGYALKNYKTNKNNQLMKKR